MIIGIGIDSIEIARVAAKCASSAGGPPAGSGGLRSAGSAALRGGETADSHPSRFMEKMFSPHEIARSLRNVRSPYQHLAACFAAREAFFKATQVWYMRNNVSIAQRPSGEPFYVLSERILTQLEQLYGPGTAAKLNICVSLTHDETHATAFAICESPG